VDDTTAYCWDEAYCKSCASDADCTGTGTRCAYDDQNFCGDAGGTYCLVNDSTCGSATPPPNTQSSKRNLERVFEKARRKQEMEREVPPGHTVVREGDRIFVELD